MKKHFLLNAASLFILIFLIGVVFSCNKSEKDTSQKENLIPFDSRWIFAQILNNRPSNNQVVEVNPPRFSWSYFPEVIIEEEIDYKHSEFTFQISNSEDFKLIHFEKKTDQNFYNALKPLPEGKWFWRVGYVENDSILWGTTQSFIINSNVPVWNREIINEANSILADISHPRICSKTIFQELDAFNQDSLLNRWLSNTITECDLILKEDWWKNFPKTDKFPDADVIEIRRQSNFFASISQQMAKVLMVYRITGDKRFAGVISRYIQLASFEPGGTSSPEWLGALTKMPTQILGHLGMVYDWFYEDLNHSQKEILLQAIEWRLKEMYFGEKGRMWKSGNEIFIGGIAIHPSSHAYQNMAWSVPAIIATVGELEISNLMFPVLLNYLTGVTIPEGPEEGYNEGTHYSVEKSNTMLDALLLIDWIIPEINMGRNPMLKRLGEWFIFMFPPGIDRLSFGDIYEHPSKVPEEIALRKLTFLTKDPKLKKAWRIREKNWENIFSEESSYPWLDIESYIRYKEFIDLPEETGKDHLVLKEAGWVFMNSREITDNESFKRNIGLIFQCRPRGGYSHSYASENSFVWYALGETLSAGGGSMLNKDSYSDESISHNTILINGHGQHFPVNTTNPQKPFFGRILASYHSDNLSYWVGDATNSYPDSLNLERFHRYVIMPDKSYFIIFDDLAIKKNSEPGLFSWLFKVAPKVQMDIIKNEDQIAVAYQMNDVYARVLFASSPDEVNLEILKDREGYINPILGVDYLPEMRQGLLQRAQFDPDTITPMHNHLWVTNEKEVKEWQLFSVLFASKDPSDYPSIRKLNNSMYEIKFKNDKSKTISFNQKLNADIVIDLELIRRHAKQSNVYTNN